MKVKNISGPECDKGTMYRPPSTIYGVEFDDGEKVDVDVDTEGTNALGMCYWPGESHEEYGRAAEVAVNASLK